MRAIAPGIGLIDLHFQGQPEYIACYVLEAGSELLLVDPGPTSTLAALDEGLRLAGLSLDSVTGLLLTHIHLDHAGVTGTLVERNPGLRVYVHRSGARHMIDPARLLASATRLYGDRMDTLWGEFLAVPERNVEILDGGEHLALGSLRLEVAYTPGHAKHHVSYFDEASGLAWVGDTAGIRIDNRAFVLPVTPPPDVDLPAWESSIATIRDWKPGALCPTHFGPARPVGAHLDEFQERLGRWAEAVRDDLATGTDANSSASRFRQTSRQEIEAALAPADARKYLAGGGLAGSWRGIARYFQKQATPGAP